MRHALVFGATGQIGAPLIELLHADGWRVTAVSRAPQRDRPGLHWLQGTLPKLDVAVLAYHCAKSMPSSVAARSITSRSGMPARPSTRRA